MLWRYRHVALYVGNNTTLQLRQSNWSKTPNGHGGGIYTGSEDFSGYVSYDGSFSDDYDPDDEDFNPDYDVSGSGGWESAYPPAEVEDGSEAAIAASGQYIKNRKAQLKHWRAI